MLGVGCDLIQPQHDFARGRVIFGLPAELEAQLEHGRIVAGQGSGSFKRGFGQGGLSGIQGRPGKVQPVIQFLRL